MLIFDVLKNLNFVKVIIVVILVYCLLYFEYINFNFFDLEGF